MNLTAQFANHLKARFPNIADGKNILVALSGGLDSMVLTHLMLEAGIPISVAHCNFQLRGNESDEDERFVNDFAQRLSVGIFVKKFETKTLAASKGISTQMAARALRYDWFGKLMEQHHFSAIATAHHADDSLETVLINLTRGTGLKGLAGIPETNGPIIRPLLFTSRKEIQDYATAHQIKWREDSSNSTDHYTRNKIRHHIIPILKEINPNLLSTALRSAARLTASHTWLTAHLAELKTQIISNHEGDALLPYKPLTNSRGITQVAEIELLLEDFGVTWDEAEMIAKLIQSPSGKHLLTKDFCFVKDREHIKIYPRPKWDNTHLDSHVIIDQDQTTCDLAGKKWRINQLNTADWQIQHDQTIGQFDLAKLQFPLTVRKWQEGDKIQPLGMRGHKLISDILIDKKLDIVQKKQVMVLCSAGQIAWVIGLQMSDFFKITNPTKRILVMQQIQSSQPSH